MTSPQITPGMPLQLLSSKLSGVFPAGLTLGEVERLEPGSDGVSKSGVVKLDSRQPAWRKSPCWCR